MKNMKRFLAMVIAAVMIVTSLPMDSVRLHVQAETGDIVENEDSISDNNGTGDGFEEQPGDQEQQDTYGALILEAADYEVAKGDLGQIFDAEKYQNAWIHNNSLAELLNSLAENKAEYAVIQHYQDLDMGSISIPETMKGLILNSGWDNENQREYSATISEVVLAGYDTELYLMNMNINCTETAGTVRLGFLPEEISPTEDAGISNNSTVIFSNCTVNGAVVTYNVAGETEETIGKIGFSNCNEIAGYDGAATTSVVGDWAELRLRTPSKLVFHDITGNANLNIYYNGYDVELIPQFHGSIDLGIGADENGNSYVNNIHVRYLEPCTDEAQNQIPAWDLEEGNGTPWQNLTTDVALKEGDRVYIPGTENREDVARVCRYERQYQEGEMGLVANEEGFLVQEQQGAPGFDDNILYRILTISKEEYDTVKENTGLIWGYFDEETQELVPSIFEGREWIVEEAGDNSRSINLALSQLDGYAILEVRRPFQMNDSLVIPEAVSGILLFGGSNDGMIQEMNSMVVAGSNTEVVLRDFNVCLPEASDGVSSFKIWFEQGNSENNSNVVLWDCYINGVLEACVSSEDATSDVAPLGTITFRGSTGLSGYEGAKVTAIEDWAELRVAKPGKLNFNEISGNGDLNLFFDGYDEQNIPSFAGPVSLVGYDAERGKEYICGIHLKFLKPYINEDQQELPAWEMPGQDAEGNRIPWPEVAGDVELEVGTKVIDIVSAEDTESILETVRYEKNWKDGEEWLAINEEGCLVIGGTEGFYSPLIRVLSVTEEDYNAIMKNMSILWGQGEGDSYQPSKFDDQWVEYRDGDINQILSSIDASYVVTEFGKDVEGTLSVPSQLKGIMFRGGWNGPEQRPNIQLFDAVEILGTETEVTLHNFMIEASENDTVGKFAVGFLPGENNSSITFTDCTVRKVISTYALANSEGEAVTDVPVGTVLFRYANRIAGYEGAKVTGSRECGELLLDAPGPLYFNEIKGQDCIHIFVNGYNADFVPVFAGPIDLGMGYNEEDGCEYRNSVLVRYLKHMEEPAWNKPYEEGDIPWPETVEDEALSVGAQIIRLATQDAAVRENILEHCEYNRFWKDNEEWLGIDENGCLADGWYFMPGFRVIALTEKEYTEILNNWDLLWGHEDENGNYVPSKYEEENRWVEGNNINELLDSLKGSECIIVCPNKDYTQADVIIPETLKTVHFCSGWIDREERPVLQNMNGVTINGKDTKVYMDGVLVPAGDSSEFRVGFQPAGNAKLIIENANIERTLVAYSLGTEATDAVGQVQIKFDVELRGYVGVKTTCVEEFGRILISNPDRVVFNDIIGDGWFNLVYNGYDAAKLPVLMGKVDLGQGFDEETGESWAKCMSIRYLKKQDVPAWSSEDLWESPIDEVLQKGAKVVDFGQHSKEEIDQLLTVVNYMTFVSEYMGYFIDETGCLTYESIVNIFFNTMGGNEIQPLQVVSGGYLTVEDPVREGYIFEGWYCDVECQIPYENWGIWEDTTFYAKWKAIPNSQGIHVECVTSYTYTGSKITPYVAVYDGDMELTKGVDYTVKYVNNVNASASLTDIGVDKTGYDASKQPMIQIVGKGNYTVSYEIPFEIYAKDICSDDMEINMVDAYEVPKKGDLKVSLTVKDGKKTLGKDKDYVVEYLDESGKVLSNADISKEGFYVLRISGKSGSNYSGTVERFFMVTSSLIPLSKAKVTIDSKARKMEYTGEEITLPANAVTVKVGSETLTEGKDYCLEYTDNWEVGKAKVYIVPMDSEDCKYCGTTFAEFEIIGTPIKKVIIENFESSLPYTGDEVFQEDMVLKTRDGEKLILGKDYWLEYNKNVNAGSATVVIHGLAGYTGSVKKKFKITPVELKADMCTDEEILAVYTSSGAKPDITLFYNDMLLENGKDYTLSYSNNKKVAKAEDAKAPTITVKGKGNYKGTLKAIKKFTICPQQLEAENVVVEDMVFVANKADTYAYKSKVTIYDNGKKVAAKNYSVQYSGNIQGDIKEALSAEQTVEAKVVIKMTEGNASYSGECEVPFRITPKALKKAKLISAIPDQVYTGEEITLESGVLQVKDASGNTLTEGVDFVIDSYAANVKTTKAAKVTIKGIGKYSGTVTFKFKIVGKKLK